MSRIDFAFGAPDRLRMACQVTSKHVRAGRRLVVYTRDTARLAKFDRLLWGFEATAFVPHVAIEDPIASNTPVLLTSRSPIPLESESAEAGSWLLNLDLDCPPGAERFGRILEIVSGHDDDKLAARHRWREYLAAGHDLRAHDVSDSSARG